MTELCKKSELREKNELAFELGVRPKRYSGKKMWLVMKEEIPGTWLESFHTSVNAWWGLDAFIFRHKIDDGSPLHEVVGLCIILAQLFGLPLVRYDLSEAYHCKLIISMEFVHSGIWGGI